MPEQKKGQGLEQGRLKNFLQSLWPGQKPAGADTDAPPEEPAYEGDLSNVVRRAEEEPPPQDDNQLPAGGNALYEAYCRAHNMPLVVDPEATFHLKTFMGDGADPTGEQHAWLRSLEVGARTFLKQRSDPDEEPVPAGVHVRVGADKMTAWVFLFPPLFLGEEATPEAVAGALAQSGVVFGLDEAAIERVCSQRLYLQLFCVAKGQPPTDGQDGQVIDHFHREMEVRLTVKDNNTIDYKDLGWLQTVLADEVICEITPPTGGSAGHNVLGRELAGKDGRKAQAPAGQGTRMNEDESRLLAAIEGVVSFEGGRFRVDPLLIIKGNVETAVGNLDVVGDVLIHGDILEGFYVKATGNITVQGMVEGAQVQAGGDIQVGRGMNGNSHGIMKAGREVRCKFIENATVTAKENIICDTIINSDVASDTSVEVTTGRGAIIGGSITALERIDAKTVGNQSNRNINIQLGNTAAFLRDKENLEANRARLTAELAEMDKNIRFLESAQGDGADAKAKRADDLRLKQSVQRMQLANVQRQLEGMDGKLVNTKACRLRAEAIYPPVSVTIGDASKILRQTYYSTTLFYKDGEIGIANV